MHTLATSILFVMKRIYVLSFILKAIKFMHRAGSLQKIYVPAKYKMHPVGFEPTHTNIDELESTPLDQLGQRCLFVDR